MTQVYADHSITHFATPDEIVTHIIRDEEVLAVCPGQVSIEPHPEVTENATKSTVAAAGTATPKKPNKNVVITTIVLVLFVLVASAFPELLHHGIEAIFGIIALPFIIFAIMMGIRIRQSAMVITADNIWVIFGVAYIKKENYYTFNIATCTPRKEIKKVSWIYRTLRVKMSGKYLLKIFQAKGSKSKYYTKKATDIVEVYAMLIKDFSST